MREQHKTSIVELRGMRPLDTSMVRQDNIKMLVK